MALLFSMVDLSFELHQRSNFFSVELVKMQRIEMEDCSNIAAQLVNDLPPKISRIIMGKVVGRLQEKRQRMATMGQHFLDV